ncbi:hypothetical protein CDAR_595251 [Caerostris darwini]|uniref:Uncharacterized protein n=1 Tax=Caerostris darwini TaxID=1538125 RepID=A0AAV4PAF9_9ARAC|nr:hypothetical protein CDAR_595251 [Caerostris darwini]
MLLVDYLSWEDGFLIFPDEGAVFKIQTEALSSVPFLPRSNPSEHKDQHPNSNNRLRNPPFAQQKHSPVFTQVITEAICAEQIRPIGRRNGGVQVI